MSLTPALFNSDFADGPQPTLLQPSYWNAVTDLLEELFDGASGSRSASLASLALTTPLPPSSGGTGLSAFVAGDLMYASDANTLARLPVGAVGTVLVGGALPSFSATLGPSAATGITFANSAVGVGTSNPSGIFHVTNGGESPASTLKPGGVVMYLTGKAATQAGTLAGISASDINPHWPGLYLRSIRARGSIDSPTAVQSGDLLSLWESEGYDGSGRQSVGNIGFFVDGFNSGATGAQSKLSGYVNVLLTPLLGTSGPIEVARFTSTTRFGMNTIGPLATIHANRSTLATAYASGLVPGGLGVLITNDSSAPFGAVGASNTGVIPGMYLRSVRARGTLASPSAVQSGDVLFKLGVDGWDGTSRVGDMAAIEAYAEGTIGTGRLPTRWVFSTSTDAATSVTTERLRIDSAGLVTITGNLSVSGTVKTTAGVAWDLGALTTGSSGQTVDATKFVTVTIGGSTVKLAVLQ